MKVRRYLGKERRLREAVGEYGNGSVRTTCTDKCTDKCTDQTRPSSLQIIFGHIWRMCKVRVTVQEKLPQ